MTTELSEKQGIEFFSLLLDHTQRNYSWLWELQKTPQEVPIMVCSRYIGNELVEYNKGIIIVETQPIQDEEARIGIAKPKLRGGLSFCLGGNHYGATSREDRGIITPEQAFEEYISLERMFDQYNKNSIIDSYVAQISHILGEREKAIQRRAILEKLERL